MANFTLIMRIWLTSDILSELSDNYETANRAVYPAFVDYVIEYLLDRVWDEYECEPSSEACRCAEWAIAQ